MVIRLSNNRIDLEGARIDQPNLNAPSYRVQDVGTKTANYTIVSATTSGAVVQITLGGNITVTLPDSSNRPSVPTSEFILTVYIVQDSTGSRTLTWAAPSGETLSWDQSSSAPAITTAASKVTRFVFSLRNGQTVWRGKREWADIPSGELISRGACALWDFGNSSCYSGSGTTINNLITSPADGATQAAYQLQRADGSTSAAYPTFNGTAGALTSSEYFSFDGTDDYISIVAAAPNPTAIENIHKAAGVGTWWAIVYNTTASSGNIRKNIASTGDRPGFQFDTYHYADDITLAAYIFKADNSNLYANSVGGTVGLKQNQWHMGVWDFDVTGGLHNIVVSPRQRNNEGLSYAFTSPATVAAHAKLHIGTKVENSVKVNFWTGRMAIIGFHNVRLTRLEKVQIFEYYRTRFGGGDGWTLTAPAEQNASLLSTYNV